MFGHLFFILCFSWNVIRAFLMEQQMWRTLEQFNGMPQDENAIQMNLKMFLCA